MVVRVYTYVVQHHGHTVSAETIHSQQKGNDNFNDFRPTTRASIDGWLFDTVFLLVMSIHRNATKKDYRKVLSQQESLRGLKFVHWHNNYNDRFSLELKSRAPNHVLHDLRGSGRA